MGIETALGLLESLANLSLLGILLLNNSSLHVTLTEGSGLAYCVDHGLKLIFPQRLGGGGGEEFQCGWFRL